MSHFRANCARKLAIIGMVVAFLCQPVLRTEAGEKTYNLAKNLARMNCGAQIDWVSPAGHGATAPIVGEQNQSPTALVWDDNTLSCPLPVGDTTFIVTLPKITLLDRFAFINENAAARGEFQLAVRDQPVYNPARRCFHVSRSATTIFALPSHATNASRCAASSSSP